jgi:hypothetical protein
MSDTNVNPMISPPPPPPPYQSLRFCDIGAKYVSDLLL